MASRNATLAEAVKTALNAAAGGTFTLSFTAKRRPVPVSDLKQLATLTVSVVSADDESQRTGRQDDTHTMRVLIGIEKRLSASDVSSSDANAEVDQLMLLVEQIDDFWDQSKVSQSVGLFLNSTIQTLADPTSMLTQKVFRGIVAVSFLYVVETNP